MEDTLPAIEITMSAIMQSSRMGNLACRMIQRP
jgi:hypothetical protein